MHGVWEVCYVVVEIIRVSYKLDFFEFVIQVRYYFMILRK